jgi:WD40 repeat protein
MNFRFGGSEFYLVELMEMLAVTLKDRVHIVHIVQDGNIIATLKAKTGSSISRNTFSHDGRLFAIDSKNVVTVYSVIDWTVVCKIPILSGMITRIHFSEDDTHVYTISDLSIAESWDARTGQQSGTVPIPYSYSMIVFYETRIELRNESDPYTKQLTSGEQQLYSILRLKILSGTTMICTSDGRVVLANEDSLVFESRRGPLTTRLYERINPSELADVHASPFSPDGRTLIFSSESVRVFDTQTLTESTIDGYEYGVFSFDGLSVFVTVGNRLDRLGFESRTVQSTMEFESNILGLAVSPTCVILL